MKGIMTTTATLPIILDGGMGRELQRIGAPFQQPQWSAQALIEAPHYIEQVHRDFIAAGAEVITTNSYALVPFHLGEQCFHEQGAQLIALAARLALQSIDNSPNVQIAGCIPPLLGSYRPDLFNVQQAKPLLDTMIEQQQQHVHLWLAETISSIDEADMIKSRCAVTNKPTWIAFTLSDEFDGEPRLRSGERVYEAVQQIAGQHVSAILFNCSCVEVMLDALVEANKALQDKGLSEVRLGVYANSFGPIGEQHQANETEGISTIREISPLQYAQLARDWIAAGATIIGGCCGISTQHIAQLSALKK